MFFESLEKKNPAVKVWDVVNSECNKMPDFSFVQLNDLLKTYMIRNYAHMLSKFIHSFIHAEG